LKKLLKPDSIPRILQMLTSYSPFACFYLLTPSPKNGVNPVTGNDRLSAKIVEGATINDLDPEALKTARNKFKEKCINEPFYNGIDAWDDLLLLDKARITIKGKITNTAILLLGKPESAHFLLPSVAEITWKLETEEKSYEHFSPPLLLGSTRVLQRIRNIKYKMGFRHYHTYLSVYQKYNRAMS
jgi:predicted HTH transcriptional regulator